MTRAARALAIACAVLTALLATAAPAAAHAVLQTATPTSGDVVRATPGSITLTYDEDVVPRYARVAVLTPRGRNLAGPPRVSGAVVVVPLTNGPVGSYTVHWRMVASNDGHVTEGAYSFGVRAKALAPAPVSGAGVPVAPEVIAWLEFVGIVLAGGVLTFRAIVLAPAARALGDHELPDSGTAVGVGVAGAALALHAGMVAFLLGSYSIVGGGLLNFADSQIIPIRVATHLGQAWTLSTFAWLGVLGLLVGAWVTPRRRESLLAAAGLLSLGIAFGISWASHPASRGSAAIIADFGHLLAAALWLGGLVALAMLARASRRLPRPRRDALVRACFLRFSKLAVPAVLVLALAGLYLALRELPAPSALLNSAYGVTLLVKSALFAGALALGAYHRRAVVPRIAAGAPVASIRRTLTLELGFLLTALAFAAILSQTVPPT